MVKDPICGMEISENEAAGKSENKGKTYYFCSPSCKATFEKEPQKYTAKEQRGSHEHHH